MQDMITDLFAKFRGGNGPLPGDDDAKPWAPKHGPQQLRHITAGQQRRAQVRRAATRRRKSTATYRRNWLENQRRLDVLRGQLQATGKISYLHGGEVKPGTAAVIGEILTKAYGSPEKALSHYLKVLEDRRQAAKRASVGA